MSDELKTIKFQLMLSESEAKAIDDWGFENRIRTRAEAIRRMCKLAILLDENLAPIGKEIDDLHSECFQFFGLFDASSNKNEKEKEIDKRMKNRSLLAQAKLRRLSFAFEELKFRVREFKHDAPFENEIKHQVEQKEYYDKFISDLQEKVQDS